MLNQQVILDRYRVIERAGRGGYATVFHAYDTLLKRDVAIKKIEISADDLERARAQASMKVRPGAILPDDLQVTSSADLPEDPSFLDKRDKRKAKRARTPSATRAARTETKRAIFSPIGNAADNDVAALAEQLPGVINGAGNAQIDAVDGNGVKIDLDDLIPVEPRQSDKNLPVINIVDGTESPVLPVIGTQNKRGKRRTTGGANFRNEHNAAAPEANSLDPAFYDNIPGLTEARSAAHLNDPNIVTVYDCVVDGDFVYVIMEYVEGKTLAHIMNDLQNDITLDIIAAVFEAVSHALEVAHSAKLLHLDIKPENVIISKKGAIKVADFGLSALMDSGGHGTTGGGTIGYMPLEQMRRRALDVRTDEWALASLTYEMLSGQNPFRAKTLREAEAAIENAELVLPSQCWADIDEAVDDMIFQALDPEPEGRFDTVKQFASGMSALLGDAKAGKKQLAKVIEGENEAEEAADSEREAFGDGVPLIDKLGKRGSSILMHAFAGLAGAMMGVVSLLNCRFSISDSLGLLSSIAPAFWAILVVLTGLCAWKPRFGMPVAYAAFSIMLLFNHAWALGFIMLVVTGAWWWLFGRSSDEMCLATMLQPLFGAVGFAAISPIMAAVMLDVREALAAAGFAVVSAIAFAALGTGDLGMWDVMTSVLTAANADIAGNTITQTLLLTVSNPATWLVAVSWIAAAGAFSLLCRRGTKLFDILGACAAAALIIGGSIANVFLSNAPLMMFNLIAAIVCGGAGIILAILEVPDRVRLEDGEW
ncbi:protein kinase [Adlercreutzia sp. ZJ304]|uniref:protein kinase domain-containing protein n=1 Tax=Adlercreutzia sp. ZJ304 TaxID=2709791 RepID=UPI0013ECA213|nr:protein kinase [Adlercreutzia sp. ZJ304]